MGKRPAAGPGLALRPARLLGASWRGKAWLTREFTGQGGKRRRSQESSDRRSLQSGFPGMQRSATSGKLRPENRNREQLLTVSLCP